MAQLAAVPAGPPSAQQALALGLRYGPNAGVALSRSQYLADVLANLQAQASQNIRTPTALWANLLADGITQWSKDKADREAISAYGQDQADLDNSLKKGTPLDPNYQPSPPPSVGETPAPAPPPPPAAATPPAAPPPAQPPGNGPALATAMSGGQPNYSPKDLDAAARMMIGEAEGEGPVGEAAAGAVAFNRLHSGFGGAKTLSDVVYQPGQFEGIKSKRAQLSADDPRYQEALQIAQGLASGDVTDPTGGATYFYNPQLQAQLGRATPSFAQGPGERIGNHVFFGGNQNAPQDQATAVAMAAPGANAAPPGGPVPYQVASNGPTPPPPAGSDGPPSPPVQAPPAASMPAPVSLQSAGAGMVPPSPAMSVVSPQEWAAVNALLQNPQTRDLGRQKLIELKLKAATPVDPSKPYWGADGRAHYAPGMEYSQAPGPTPSSVLQYDPQHKLEVLNIPGMQGSAPEGTVYNPATKSFDRIPTQQQQTFRIPGVSGAFVNGPNGPTKVGEDQYGPEQLFGLRKQVLDSDAYKNFQAANDAYGAMIAAAKQPNGGMRAYAFRDTFARLINPGAVARVGTIQAITEAQGIPADIKAFFMNLKGDGNVPPEIAQQILDVSQGFLASHYQSAKALNDSNADFAKRHNLDPQDVTAPLPDLPGRFVIGGGAGAPAASGNADQLRQQARAAIAAGKDPALVKQRLQALGVNPAGL